jgi:TolA-binding protein
MENMPRNDPAKESYDEAYALYLKNRYSQAKKVLVENISQYPDYVRSHLLLG